MRFYYFLQLQRQLDVICEVLLSVRGYLSFRRFDTTGGTEYGFTTVNLDEDDLPSVYMGGGFTEMYIALKSIPRRFDDWDYADRAQILIEGGHQCDGVICQSLMQLIDKRSRAKSLFAKLQRALRKQCTAQGLYANPKGNFYAQFYYDPQLLSKFRLQEGLDDDGYVFEADPR